MRWDFALTALNKQFYTPGRSNVYSCRVGGYSESRELKVPGSGRDGGKERKADRKPLLTSVHFSALTATSLGRGSC